MTNRLIAAAGLALALTFGAAPSLACRITKDFDVKDLEPADVIVLGRIQNYKVVRERYPYARFDVVVDQVVKGAPRQKLTVVWGPGSFEPPERMTKGEYFVALRKPNARTSTYAKDASWEVVAEICGQSYMFPVDSWQAERVRRFVKF